jgi:hypothetical protein
MNQQIPNSTSFTGIKPDSAAKYEAAHKKTQAMRDKIKLQKDYDKERKEWREYSQQVEAILAENNISRDEFESDFKFVMGRIGANPEAMTSEQFAQLLELDEFDVMNRYYSYGLSGYEDPQGDIGYFIEKVKHLKELKIKSKSDISNTEREKIIKLIEEIESNLDDMRESMVSYINKIQKNKDGREGLVFIPKNIPNLPPIPNQDERYGDYKSDYIDFIPRIYIYPNGETINAELSDRFFK